jgi:hypothetical protein
MDQSYDYIGLKNIFTAQVIIAVLLLLVAPINLVARYDSGGVISDAHMAALSVETVGWICAGIFMVLGLTRMRDYSEWFDKAWRFMVVIVTMALVDTGVLVTAVMLGPMQVREGIDEIKASYQTYWLFWFLLLAALAILLVVIVLGVLFNRVFLWGCAEISAEHGHHTNEVVCRLLFPVCVATLIGGFLALIFYYYQSLNGTVDSKMMESAKLYLRLMGVLWALTQLTVLVVTWRTWQIGSQTVIDRDSEDGIIV